MDPLMVLMMSILRVYCLETHWYLLVAKCDPDKGIKLGYTSGKVCGIIIGNLYGITLWIDIGTDLGSLDGYFGGSIDGYLEGLLLGVSLGSTDVNTLALYLKCRSNHTWY